ncbi:helix-turn-helix domain-containing protein [Prochlorococcus marinus]|uniref:helix-turn-helix domain-containing protein n=1 Tax=Prochlorococcus marinus TaxID=1219 RepID=UPI0022B5A50E|nr:helix-turn-helix domain-containing protein [Prochlorococcus marinus]
MFRWIKNDSKIKLVIQKNKYPDKESIQKAGLLLREQREQNGINIITLSQRTKISVTVIESIENGWIENLPERTYLISMLKILEKELNIEETILEKLLFADIKANKGLNVNHFKMKENQSIYYSRYNLYYFFCILISIFFLNVYQIYLAKKNVLTTNPLYFNNINEENPSILMKEIEE